MRRTEKETQDQNIWQKIEENAQIGGLISFMVIIVGLVILNFAKEAGYEPVMTEEQIYYNKFVSLAHKIYTEKCNNEYHEMVDLIKFVTKKDIPASAIEEAKRQLAQSK